jgi:hypothetical protein
MQCWDDAEAARYFYHRRTGESRWTPPTRFFERWWADARQFGFWCEEARGWRFYNADTGETSETPRRPATAGEVVLFDGTRRRWSLAEPRGGGSSEAGSSEAGAPRERAPAATVHPRRRSTDAQGCAQMLAELGREAEAAAAPGASDARSGAERSWGWVPDEAVWAARMRGMAPPSGPPPEG